MKVQINYKNISSEKNPVNYVLFTDENFNILNLKNHLLKIEYSFVSDLLKSKDLKKKIISFDVNSKKKNYLNIVKKKYK